MTDPKEWRKMIQKAVLRAKADGQIMSVLAKQLKWSESGLRAFYSRPQCPGGYEKVKALEAWLLDKQYLPIHADGQGLPVPVPQYHQTAHDAVWQLVSADLKQIAQELINTDVSSEAKLARLSSMCANMMSIIKLFRDLLDQNG